MENNDDIKDVLPESMGLKRDMKGRHLLMISIGGTIGSGLFMGIGHTIHTAGPLGAVLAYIVGGFVMYLVLLCLGELASVMPISGSFSTYAYRFISPAAGFATGWIYWLSWALTIAADFTVAGILMNNWVPGIPVYIWCALFAGILSILNLLTVKAYGETEYWFASIKVIAIIAFIIAGTGLILGLGPTHQFIGWHNFNTGRGLFPNGARAIFMTMLVVVFSFQGTELVGIAAGECEDPEKNIPKVTKAVVVRIVLFFWLAVTVLAATIPFEKAGVLESPFAYVFGLTGIPYAKELMSFVVLTAALSSGNSGLYASSRMLWSMAQQGQAPSWLKKLNSHGVPYNAILITVVVACASLLTKTFAADTVYLFLISSTGMAGCLSWIVIAICQYRFRREFLARGGKVEQLIFKSPMFPLTPILAIVLNGIVILGLCLDPSNRMMLASSVIVIVITYIIGIIVEKKNYHNNLCIKEEYRKIS